MSNISPIHSVSTFLRLTLTAALILNLLPASMARAIDRDLFDGHRSETQAPTTPAAPSITAIKTDALLTDNDGDNRPSPGDTLRYTAVIRNNGDMEAMGVVFSDTIDANTTLSSMLRTTPLALNNSYTTTLNTPLSIAAPGVLANDTGAPAPTVLPFSGATTQGGTVTVNADGSFVYTPTLDFASPPADSFSYTVANALGSDSAMVTIEIESPPTAHNDTYDAGKDTSLSIVTPGVLANDSGSPPPAVIPFSGSTSQGGAVTVKADGSFVYTPTLGFESPPSDSFTYTISNGIAPEATATVSITVRPGPAANDDMYATPFNTPLDIATLPASVLDNDAGTPALTVIAFGPSAAPGNTVANGLNADTGDQGGTVVFRGDGSFVYTPTAGFSGLDAFGYTISNGTPLTTTAVVTVTVGTAPSAANDGRNVSGNIQIDTSLIPFSLLDNDNGGSLSITAFQPTSDQGVLLGQGGEVNVNPDGSFTYNPPPGFEGIDIFTYTVANGLGEAVGTVQLTVSDMIWFIDHTAGGGGDGRLTSPLNSLSAFNAIDADDPGDVIFLYEQGGGDYSGGITLLNDQQLIGQGVDLQTASGITPAAGSLMLPRMTGNPTLANAGGDGITLAQNNTICGLTVGDTPTGYGILGNPGPLGTLTISNVSIAGSGAALNLNDTTLDVSFDNIASTNSQTTFALGVFNSSGSFTVNGASTVNNPASSGIDISGSSATFSFNSVDIDNTGAAGIALTNNTGTVAIGGGDISGAAGVAVDIDEGAADITYGGTINNTVGRSVEVTNRSGGAVTFSGAINDTGSGILVQDNSGGRTTFSGSSKTLNTGANTAITLSNNSGHTINFAGGGLAITTSTGTGFSATGGAAGVNVTGGGNTISAAGGVALVVNNTTVGADGLTFQSISANGGSNGIILDSTGLLGGLTVTGNAGACAPATPTCSGGRIQTMSGANNAVAGRGISLNNTQNVSLNLMRLHDFSNFAIRGDNVTSFRLTNSYIHGVNGDSDADDEGSMRFVNLLRSADISGSNISGGLGDNLRIDNDAGTLDRLIVSGTTIGANSTTMGNNGILVQALNSAVVNVSVTGSTFTSARGDLIQTEVLNNAVMDLVFMYNTLSNNHPNISSSGGGVTFSGGGAGSNVNFTYDISNNSFRDAQGIAVNVFKGTGAGLFSGRIMTNTIGVSGVTDSGSSLASGIQVTSNGNGTHTTLIENNQIYHYVENGIYVRASDGSSTINATIRNNTMAQPESFALNGLQLNIGATSSDTNFACADIVNNSMVGSGDPDFNLRQRFGTTIRLPGYGGASGDTAAVIAFVQSNNVGTPSGAASASSTGGGFVGGVGCPQPAMASARSLDRGLAMPRRANTARPGFPPVANSGQSGDFGLLVVSSERILDILMPTEDTRVTKEAQVAPGMTLASPLPVETARTGRPAVFKRDTPITPVDIGILPAGKAITITFEVTIDDPFPEGVTQVANQGLVSGSNFADVVTDDPDTGAPNDPTVTPVGTTFVIYLPLVSRNLVKVGRTPA